MRIEPAKNKEVDKQETRINKTENSLFNPSNQTQATDSAAPTTGAFAKILAEARKQAGKDNSAGQKTDSSESATETSRSDNEQEVNQSAEPAKELEEKNKEESGGEPNSEDDNSSLAASLAAIPPEAKSAAENSVPAARAILHVADLERIVSTIRTQNFKTPQQVIIDLKHSV